MTSSKILGGIAVLATAPLALAVFTSAEVPSFRGMPDTEYAYWESFTSPFSGPNLPDGEGSTTDDASVTQTVPGAILTGSDIYNPAGASQFVLTDSVPGDLLEVVLQVSTQGLELDYSLVTLAYIDGSGTEVIVPWTAHTILAFNSGLGVDVESRFDWDLSSNTDNISNFELRFDASAAHLSLDAVLLDTRHSPLNGAAFCFGDGTGRACPCGNNGGAGRGCANSSEASGAFLSASGTTTLAAGDLVLHGSGLPPQQPGLYFQGDNAVGGGIGQVFGDGLRCAGGNVMRLEIANSDSLGESTSTVNIGQGGGVLSGQTKRYQLWYRDPSGSPCGSAFNLSNGLELTWN